MGINIIKYNNLIKILFQSNKIKFNNKLDFYLIGKIPIISTI